jgi:hypothetical protein
MAPQGPQTMARQYRGDLYHATQKTEASQYDIATELR